VLPSNLLETSSLRQRFITVHRIGVESRALAILNVHRITHADDMVFACWTQPAVTSTTTNISSSTGVPKMSLIDATTHEFKRRSIEVGSPAVISTKACHKARWGRR